MASATIQRAKRVAELIRQGVNKPADIVGRINQEPLLAYKAQTKEAKLKAFERDIDRLVNLGQRFVYDAKRACYVEAEDSEPGMHIHLTDDELDVLAQLSSTFHLTPYRDAASRLQDKLIKVLTPDQRKLTKRPPKIRMRIQALDELATHAHSATMIDQAFREQRDMVFSYQPPNAKTPFDMHVQVIGELELRDGHFYFDFQSLRTDIQRSYRLSRVVPGSAKLLPKRRPPRTRKRFPLMLKYWLSADLEPTRHFPDEFKAEKQEDGWIVTAKIDERDLFHATKILLRYGGNCVVLEPPVLVDEMRRAVEDMARKYGLLEGSDE